MDTIPDYEMLIEVMMLYLFVYTVKGILAHAPTITQKIMGSSGSATTIYAMAKGMVNSASNAISGGDPIEKYNNRSRLKDKDDKELKDTKEIKDNIQTINEGIDRFVSSMSPSSNKTRSSTNKEKEKDLPSDTNNGNIP